jgi:dienelactone hydrolase
VAVPIDQQEPAVNGSRAGIARRATIARGCALVLALTAIALALFLPRALRSVSFLDGIAGQTASTFVRAFDVGQIDEHVESIDVPGRSLTAKLLLPHREHPSTAIVVIHGFHPLGTDDPRFLSFARAAAHAGFAVIAPDFPEMRNFRVDVATVEGAEGALRWALSHPEFGRRIGALGISYGAGPAFIAADHPDLRDRVAFVLSIGGYFDLHDTLRFALTGDFEDDGKTTHERPHPWARLIFALNHAELLVPEPDRTAFVEAIHRKLDLDDAGAAAAAGNLGPEASKLYASLCDFASPDLGALLERVEPAIQKEGTSLSLAVALQTLSARTYLLHGYGDDVIPRNQTERIAAALRAAGHPPREVLITAVFSHVTPRETSLSEKLALWRFAYRFLGEAD